MGMPKLIVAIAGHSGAGKSTIIEKLVSKLPDAMSLGMDDYAASSHYPPVKSWLDNGANPDEFETPQFVGDIKNLKSGRSITHPESTLEVKPAAVLIIEEPFGRSRKVMNDLIDYVVYIDIPMEIAHARKILRRNSFLPWNDDPELFMTNLREHLNWYLNGGRDFFAAVGNHARKDCDLIINGNQSTDLIVEELVKTLTGMLE